MWVHEGFTNYSEILFTDYYYGKEAGNAYCQGIRKGIRNDIPIIGPYGVNREGSGDMYPKAANMIHNIRQIMNDDEKFRAMLHGMNKTFYHQTVTTKQIEDYVSAQAGRDLSKIFDQYLRTIQIPVLEYKLKKGTLNYRWTNCVKGFDMPVKITAEKDKYDFIYPTETIQKTKIQIKNASDFKVDENFYIQTDKLK
jgi:aminopeptidase N